MDLPEMGIDGWARVVAIEPCPIVASAEAYRPVTGRFVRTALVMELSVEGVDGPIGTTPSHPFWSLDRMDWVPAAGLSAGERLMTIEGRSRVLRASSVFGLETVYNLEVFGDHNYAVSDAGLLVHNTCRTNKVEATKGAGPHTGFKQDPQTGEITGYTTFDGNGTPVKRFRAKGGSHGGVDPPIIYEAKPGKGANAPLRRVRPARADEIPGGGR
jgi:hypothetical protein